MVSRGFLWSIGLWCSLGVNGGFLWALMDLVVIWVNCDPKCSMVDFDGHKWLLEVLVVSDGLCWSLVVIGCPWSSLVVNRQTHPNFIVSIIKLRIIWLSRHLFEGSFIVQEIQVH